MYQHVSIRPPDARRDGFSSHGSWTRAINTERAAYESDYALEVRAQVGGRFVLHINSQVLHPALSLKAIWDVILQGCVDN
eukprot:140754-Pyramimonas_sp.AAC.1